MSAAAHLEGGLGADGRREAEPAGGAGEDAVPRLVDQPGAGQVGLFLPQVMEAVGSFCIQAQAEVVPKQPLHLQAPGSETQHRYEPDYIPYLEAAGEEDRTSERQLRL